MTTSCRHATPTCAEETHCTSLQAHTLQIQTYAHTYIQYIHPLNGPLSRTTRVSRYQKGKTNRDFTEARDSGISWAICKSASSSRQITTPEPHHLSFFIGRMPFLSPNQQRQSTEGKTYNTIHTYTNKFIQRKKSWNEYALLAQDD